VPTPQRTHSRSDAASAKPVDFGPYRLVRRIGAGGMGEVYLALEPGARERRVCVVKKVLPALVANRSFVGRFLDEARVVTRLHHVNVARVYGMGEVAGQYYLAMEYVQGKTVSRFMHRLRSRKKVMDPGLVLLLGERICQGLAYAHEAKDEHGSPLHLVHRDLSPANVCVSYRGEVKIIDFGAAQSTLKEEQTAPRVVIGNLTYMSPEQARKQFVDRRADVYGCGVVLWELLSWQPLPQKGDPIERWRKAANPVWEPPTFHQPDLPRDVSDVVLKALRPDPAARYPDASALGAELKKLRERFYPRADDAALARALCDAFPEEKAAEDEVLASLEEAGTGLTDIPTDARNRPLLVPPTALAFEHAGVEDREGGQSVSVHTQIMFGELHDHGPGAPVRGAVSLMHEIHGTPTGEYGYETASYPVPEAWRRKGMGTFGAVAFFIVAMLAGFGLVWLLGN
jgi:serine/threonine protein kinase